MIKSDVHIHTNFSCDSATEINCYIENAIELGFNSICVTDHYDIIYLHDTIEGEQSIFNTDEYLKNINDIKKKYEDKIEVLIGIEMGLSSHLKTQIDQYLSKYNFDFVIGSSHFVENVEVCSSIEFWKSRNEKEVIFSYFETVLENVKIFDNYDVYGHLDYVIRYAPNKDRFFDFYDYRDILEQILKILIKTSKGLEINTSGLRHGLRYPNPHKDILKMYKSLGGKIITVGSDAHTPDYLGYEFRVVKKMMKEIGFEHYVVYKNRVPKFYKI
jgi:histidinol-phosphatase (PHP family)